MVVLKEEFHGMTLKRKGADEPELFDARGDDRAGFPLSCRATKMRRLESHDGGAHHQDAPAAGGVMAEGQDDVPMCDEPAPTSGGGEEQQTAMVLYCGGGVRSDAVSARGVVPRVTLQGGEDWVRAMLREADTRTVRELLAGAQEQGRDDLALAVVPWVPPSSAGEDTEPSTAVEEADGGDDEGAAAMDMDVEEDEAPGRRWTGQAYGSAAAEGIVYRWPQHCMAPPQMPAVAQPSPVMWSW